MSTTVEALTATAAATSGRVRTPSPTASAPVPPTPATAVSLTHVTTVPPTQVLSTPVSAVPPAQVLPTPAPVVLPAPVEHTVHWFRKGLRLHDNPSLKAGLVNAASFRCIFLVDPWFASSSTEGINKWRFLLQCLDDLDASLRKLNSRLYVVRGQPADVLPKLLKKWGTTSLTFEEDPEPYGRVRDHNIISKCREIGVKVISRVSHTLYKLDVIIERNGGKAPLTYHQFQALIASMPPPPAAEPTICLETLNGATTPILDDHDDHFAVPTLEELGFETDKLTSPVWIGGESEALTRLERHLERKAWVATNGRPKMTPQSLLASQTGLSPYLRFGCLSTRLFYYQLTELYERVKKNRPPLSLHGQILWREFFYCAATRNPNFDRMAGNPICVQIPWEKNPDALQKWGNGQSGYPWIDAIMIQLRKEGWIHHLSRHAVACFLTRGDLWISWEEGMKVFDKFLLDADWSVNAGMWMWLSCSSFFQQFFHCYCPVRFGRKTDPNGEFIRKYLPMLKDMPARYIHEPWIAPMDVQEAAKCIIGRDYPMPIVDHAKVSKVNIERMKQVYTQLSKFNSQEYPNYVQSSNVTLSLPSPTSIIASVNQSNFLCSLSSPNPPVYNDAQIFQKPMKLAPIHRSDKHTYKEIIIMHKVQKATLQNLTESQKALVATNNIYAPTKMHQSHVLPNPSKSGSHEFKNLAISSRKSVQTYSSQNYNVMLNQKSNPEQAMEINNFNTMKNDGIPDYPDKEELCTDIATITVPSPVGNSETENGERTKDKKEESQTNDASEFSTGNDENNQSN